MDFKKRDVVKDEKGNHFIFLRPLGNGLVLVESVATRETFNVPIQDLQPTDRVVF